jgi:hypothetical protein
MPKISKNLEEIKEKDTQSMTAAKDTNSSSTVVSSPENRAIKIDGSTNKNRSPSKK